MAKKKQVKKFPIGKVISITLIIFVLMFFGIMLLGIISLMFVDEISEVGNVALIKIEGPIMVTKQSTFGAKVVSSTEVVKLLKKVEEKDDVKAVILDINSPGGSAVASAEIANAVKKLNKTTVAVIREVGASGAYWVASASDRIFAHELSMTGSIGVRGSYIEYAGLLERYNMTYQRLVSGKYKDAGSPFRELKPDERRLFQQKLDILYDAFVKEVAINRGLSDKKVRQLATGFIYIGSEAKENGLIDEFGGKQEAVNYLEEKLGIKAEIGEYKTKATLSDVLGELYFAKGYSVGRGIGDSFLENGQLRIET